MTNAEILNKIDGWLGTCFDGSPECQKKTIEDIFDLLVNECYDCFLNEMVNRGVETISELKELCLNTLDKSLITEILWLMQKWVSENDCNNSLTNNNNSDETEKNDETNTNDTESPPTEMSKNPCSCHHDCSHCRDDAAHKVEQEQEWVNHPNHYNSGKYEVIEIIKDQLSAEQYEGFLLGSAIKYIMRCGKKNPDKKYEDIAKAIWYLEYFCDLEDNNE